MNKDEVDDEEEEINFSIDIVDIVSSNCDDLTKSEKVKSIQTCELKEDYLEEDKILTYDLKDDDEIREYKKKNINANNVRRGGGDMEQREIETGDIETMGI